LLELDDAKSAFPQAVAEQQLHCQAIPDVLLRGDDRAPLIFRVRLAMDIAPLRAFDW
jgi:hypothetical protein